MKRTTSLAVCWLALIAVPFACGKGTNGGLVECSNVAFSKADLEGSNPSIRATLVDLNGDGVLDLVVSPDEYDKVSVFLGKANGAFAPRVDYASNGYEGPCLVAAADLNGDGKPDLAVANYDTDLVSVFLNEGDGTFGEHVEYTTKHHPMGIAIADVDGDGHPDLVVPSLGEGSEGAVVQVYRNEGDGTFAGAVEYPTEDSPFLLVATDLNGDGKPDLAIGHGGVRKVSVHLNRGDGTFAEPASYPTPSGPASLAAADLNGDGLPDLVTANGERHTDTGSDTVSVLLNEGDGTFAARVDYAASTLPFFALPADVNGDGSPDLVVSNAGDATLSVLVNAGDGTFTAPVSVSLDAEPAGLAAADLDGDGRIDVVVTSTRSAKIRVLRNTCE
jgi:hypothetical protein